MIDPLTVIHKSNWVELKDPAGKGTSRVPADRVDYYLDKGFKRSSGKSGKGGARRSKAKGKGR
jgi:hypothetical protein